MPNPLTLQRAWRILKEVDLEAIRREAETPMRVLVVAETTADADDVAVLLAGSRGDPTNWLTAIDAKLAVDQAAARSGAVVDGPDLVITVARGGTISPALASVQQAWIDRHAPVVAIDVTPGRAGRVVTQGPVARLGVEGLDADTSARVAQAVFALVRPDQRVALARQLPGLRPAAFDELISETARANAGYSFSMGLAESVPLLSVPLNIGDIIVLTKNQLVMSYRIALAAGKHGRPAELVGEIVGVLGGGLVFRQIARQLVGLVPVFGIVPKVAVAYGGTWAIGRAVALWATEGRRVTGERLKALTREGMSRGRAVARRMKSKS